MESMEYSRREDDSMLSYEKDARGLVICLSGELDHRMASLVRADIDRLIEQNRPRRLVFQLDGLRFMDSSGIGLIIGRYKVMARRGGSVAVVGADAKIDQIIEMSGLYQLVEREA